MRILIWDFDGVIVDTVRECHSITLSTIAREKEYLAQEAGVLEYTPIPFSDFEVYRSKSVNAADFFANYILHKTGRDLSEGNLERITRQHGAFLKRMDATFYEERERLMNADMRKYFSTLKVYAGIPKALESLTEDGVHHAIMSARDAHSIGQILEHFKLRAHFEYIIGHEVDKGNRHVKGMQIGMLKEHFAEKYGGGFAGNTSKYATGQFGNSATGSKFKPDLAPRGKSKEPYTGPLRHTSKIDYFFIDDIPFNLRKVRGEAALLFASWGYGKLEEGYVEAVRIKSPKSISSYFESGSPI